MSRLLKLLEIIPTDEYITSDALSQILNVSSKTIRNDIIALNRFFNEQGAEIISKPRYGFYLKIIDLDTLEEIFEGEQDNNNIVVAHTPIPESETVYLNGLKQIEGNERDYRKTADNTFHFNFYNLLPSDVVEVVYRYVAGQED